MIYRKLSAEELKQYPYPNLIAEWIASGYSVCTLGTHMGLPGRREEDDPEMMDKLHGRAEIMANEALGLSRLFGASMEYLFSRDLSTDGDQPIAYARRAAKERGKKKIPFEFVSKLDDIHFRYTRLTSLIGLLQLLAAEMIEVAGIPQDGLSDALYEIEIGMKENNNRLKEIFREQERA